jgi:hypothetical protein
VLEGIRLIEKYRKNKIKWTSLEENNAELRDILSENPDGDEASESAKEEEDDEENEERLALEQEMQLLEQEEEEITYQQDKLEQNLI